MWRDWELCAAAEDGVRGDRRMRLQRSRISYARQLTLGPSGCGHPPAPGTRAEEQPGSPALPRSQTAATETEESRMWGRRFCG